MSAMQSNRVTPGRSEHFDTIVIGGGQAGLATAQQLLKRGVDVVVLDAHPRVGDQWRNRWDSLRLFTPGAFDGLPDMVFPSPTLHLPDKDEVVAYLERYVERFDLPVRNNERVESVVKSPTGFVVRTARALYRARNVVVATGAFQRPRVPLVSRELESAIHQLHSSEYRNPFALPDGPVLVVGAGNSGAQIALELSRFRKVWLAGRNTGHMRRRLLGRDIFQWLWPILTYATTKTRLGRHLRRDVQRSGDALIGIPEVNIRNAGIVRVGAVERVRGGLPVCGKEVVHPRVVIWCTGYVTDFRWIDLPAFDASGVPQHERGVSSRVPGLYFVGLRFQYRLTSSLLGGVGSDATFIAEQIARGHDDSAAM